MIDSVVWKRSSVKPSFAALAAAIAFFFASCGGTGSPAGGTQPPVTRWSITITDIGDALPSLLPGWYLPPHIDVTNPYAAPPSDHVLLARAALGTGMAMFAGDDPNRNTYATVFDWSNFTHIPIVIPGIPSRPREDGSVTMGLWRRTGANGPYADFELEAGGAVEFSIWLVRRNFGFDLQGQILWRDMSWLESYHAYHRVYLDRYDITISALDITWALSH